RTADGRLVMQPRYFLGKFLEFIEVAKFPGAAGSVQQEQFVFAAELSFFPVLVERADIAHKWRNASYRTHQQMVGPANLSLQREFARGCLAHEQFIANL